MFVLNGYLTTGSHNREGRLGSCQTRSVEIRVRALVGPSPLLVLRSKSGKQLEAT